MTPPVLLTVQATDMFGETTTEPLVVDRVGDEFVSLAPRDGKKLLVNAAELRAAMDGDAL